MTTQELEEKLGNRGQTIIHRIHVFLNEAPGVSDLTITNLERLQEALLLTIPQQTMKHVKTQVETFNRTIEELRVKISNN